MGIKHFFPWITNNFRGSIYYIRKNKLRSGYVHKIIKKEIQISNINSTNTKLNIQPNIHPQVSSRQVNIDNLLIDLNGMIHTSAQKIFKYGKYEEKENICDIAKSMNIKFNEGKIENKLNNEKLTKYELYDLVFSDICDNVVKIIDILKPAKRLVIHIDGPAPKAKQNQQRQRRFRAAYENKQKEGGINEEPKKEWKFTSSSMSPGTKYMELMSKFVKNYFISYCEKNNLEFVFSDDKYPGEGEHKCMKFAILNEYEGFYKNKNAYNESYCIYGNDADLIMLTIGTHIDNFYVLRDDMYNEGNFYFLNITTIKDKLLQMMKWEENSSNIKISNTNFSNMYCLNDFIFMCFMVGNDFLPNIPSLEILSVSQQGSTRGGIDLMLDIYKQVGKKYGHLTYYKENVNRENISGKNVYRINKKALVQFLYQVSRYEEQLFTDKYNNKNLFPDTLLNESVLNGKLNLELYRSLYHTKKLKIKGKDLVYTELNRIGKDSVYTELNKGREEYTSLSSICNEYLEGLNWVLRYYIKQLPNKNSNIVSQPHYDVPSWNWCYNHHYAPFASDLFKYINSYKTKIYINTKPHLPYEQLLSILPPSSKKLLPRDMRSIFTNEKLKKYYPESVVLDKSGKRKDWEAITIVPIIDHKLLKKEYKKIVKEMKIKNPNDLKRNIHTEIYTLNKII